jgi:hypothetical protein
VKASVGLERHFQRQTVLLLVVVGFSRAVLLVLATALPSTAQTFLPSAEHYEYLAAVIETLGWAQTAGRLAPYIQNRDTGINTSAKTLVETYRGLQQIEMQAYDARIQLLRGNANLGEIRVRAAELRSHRQVLLENMLLSMKIVVFAAYDMQPGGDPNATLHSVITEQQRQQLLQSIKTLLGEQVTRGPKEEQDPAVAAGAFLFEKVSKINPCGPKGK